MNKKHTFDDIKNANETNIFQEISIHARTLYSIKYVLYYPYILRENGEKIIKRKVLGYIVKNECTGNMMGYPRNCTIRLAEYHMLENAKLKDGKLLLSRNVFKLPVISPDGDSYCNYSMELKQIIEDMNNRYKTSESVFQRCLENDLKNINKTKINIDETLLV